MSEVRVRVMTGDEFRAWNSERERGSQHPESCRQAIAEVGWAPIVFYGELSFTWVCPGCGHVLGGSIGSEPVSGWERPQWVRTGQPDAPTLTPSLGCPRWREGACSGHYWLRDGTLVAA